MIATWPCPLPDGRSVDELLFSIEADDTAESGKTGEACVLIVPPLFGEHNLMRRQLVLVMRSLAAAGIASHMPDLPGLNESVEPLADQTIAHWRSSIRRAVEHLGATYVFAVRSGALLAPDVLPGILYEPQSGAKLLRGMIRAQSIANREAGIAEQTNDMMQRGLVDGIVFSGWHLGAHMVRELETANVAAAPDLREIQQSQVSNAGLWLRAEPSQDVPQAEQIAHIIAAHIQELGSQSA